MFNESGITSLDVHHPYDTEEKLEVSLFEGILKNIKRNSTLESLNIISFQMKSQRLKGLTKVLEGSNIKIQSLGIINDHICNEGGKLIEKFLHKDTTITSLNLSGLSFIPSNVSTI
ncbi:24778_t:CDS:1, partial [Dentiscutata erythropus]